MKLSPVLRGFVAGIAVTLILLVSAWAFLAYQQPDLLLQMANLRYCG